MVLSPEVVRQRLLRLEEVVSRLEELTRLDPTGLRQSVRDMWAVERGLHLAAEITFDIGNHILSAHFGVSAQDYEDILVRLQAHGVIKPALGDRLKGLGGFRNLLVHGYARLDPDRVVEHLQSAPARFAGFAADVREWLDDAVR